MPTQERFAFGASLLDTSVGIAVAVSASIRVGTWYGIRNSFKPDQAKENKCAEGFIHARKTNSRELLPLGIRHSTQHSLSHTPPLRDARISRRPFLDGSVSRLDMYL